MQHGNKTNLPSSLQQMAFLRGGGMAFATQTPLLSSFLLSSTILEAMLLFPDGDLGLRVFPRLSILKRSYLCFFRGFCNDGCFLKATEALLHLTFSSFGHTKSKEPLPIATLKFLQNVQKSHDVLQRSQVPHTAPSEPTVRPGARPHSNDK